MASSLNGNLKSPAPRRSLYFVNGITDFVFIGGFSMLAFAGLRLFDVRGGSASLYAVSAMLSWVCNLGFAQMEIPRPRPVSCRGYYGRPDVCRLGGISRIRAVSLDSLSPAAAAVAAGAGPGPICLVHPKPAVAIVLRVRAVLSQL